MIANQLFRFIHTKNSLWQASNKTLLAKLRKKTGYTFSNCRKALELHENDINKAEEWLKQQAQTLGWSKATKLEGRATMQGLIAVMVKQNHAALVEVNCETDFVARNKQFQGLLSTTASAALKYASAMSASENILNKVNLDTSALKELPAADGKPLADHSALVIGSVGENMCIRRALCVSAREGVSLAGYSHPAPSSTSGIPMGKYAALVAFQAPENQEQLGRQLCQHIIGMNPLKIGQKGVDEPNPVSDDETTMIFQEFLLDPSITVDQVLTDSQANVLDFARFEVGESIEGEQSLESVETCG